MRLGTIFAESARTILLADITQTILKEPRRRSADITQGKRLGESSFHGS